MRRTRAITSWVVVAASLLAVCGCTIGQQGPDSIATSDFRPQLFYASERTPTVQPVLPALPIDTDRGSFLRFESGATGAALLSPEGSVECTVNRWFGSSTFTATTSNFGMFDDGSLNPGEDFSIEVHLDESQQSVTVVYVEMDGRHRTVDAWGPDGVVTERHGETGIAFAVAGRQRQPDSPSPVSATGFIRCDEVVKIP